MVALQIKLWNKKIENTVLHSGEMHTIMSFLGCIGNLIRESGIDVLVPFSI